MSVGHVHGWRGIVRASPPSQTTVVEHGLTKSQAAWWDPLDIWGQWSECLKKMPGLIIDTENDEHVKAYQQAMNS